MRRIRPRLGLSGIHVAVSKDDYFISADGYLMPVHRDQPAPDLRYFKTRK
jgi:hypothetical protein